jgi:hypothetical protein
MNSVLNKPLTPVAPSTSVAAAHSAATSVPAGKPPVTGSAPPKLMVVTEESYKYLQQEIYRQSGIVLDDDKHYLLESRLMPVARAAKLASLDELCSRLRTGVDAALNQKFIEALTTNETLFFRDIAPFDALRQKHGRPATNW